MDEVLSVLISKTKLEGEDALRKVVSSLNGLVGIAILREKLTNAVSLYKEGLALAEEHSEDFRLDPLLNIHILNNLAEILKSASSSFPIRSLLDGQFSGILEQTHSQVSDTDRCGNQIIEGYSKDEKARDVDPQATHVENMLNLCGKLKSKYLLVFYTRLSGAQEEFQKSYTQVCNSLSDGDFEKGVWWLEALQHIEQNKEAARELSQKIEDAVLPNKTITKTSTIASRFSSLTSLKYYIKTGMDSLEASRKRVLDHLLEIDQRMKNPRDEDVERVRNCSGCYINREGPLCVHCELNKSFQAYEARLFLKQRNDGGVIESAEEALELEEINLARNSFMSKLEHNSTVSGKRDAGKMLVMRILHCHYLAHKK